MCIFHPRYMFNILKRLTVQGVFVMKNFKRCEKDLKVESSMGCRCFKYFTKLARLYPFHANVTQEFSRLLGLNLIFQDSFDFLS